MRRRGLTVKSQTDAIFAVDTKTGEAVLGCIVADNILAHHDRHWPRANVYFIDSSISPEERQAAVLEATRVT